MNWGGALHAPRDMPTNAAHVHKMISDGKAKCAWKVIEYLDKLSCGIRRENAKREKDRTSEVTKLFLEYFSAETRYEL